MKLELSDIQKRSVYGGQTIMIQYIVYDGEETYGVQGRVAGLYGGHLEFEAESVTENLTWTENTLTEEAILDKVNDYIRGGY